MSYSENTDWLIKVSNISSCRRSNTIDVFFNFDTSLYYNHEDYDLTISFGTNETENIKEDNLGEEKRDKNSTFFNAKLDLEMLNLQ